MHNRIRILSIALAALGLVDCSEIGRGSGPTASRRVAFALEPQFDQRASQTAATLAAVGLGFDKVRVVVVRPAGADTLADTTVAYQPTDTALTLVVGVLAVPDEQLAVTLQYKSGTTVLFQGTTNATATSLNATVKPSNTVTVLVKYIGPGATAAKITIAPGAGSYPSGIGTQFTAKAFDPSGVDLGSVPIVWSVSDSNVAAITSSGVLTPKGLRGTVNVVATLPGLSQSVTVTFSPPAAGMRIVQGAAQTASPGTTLPLPLIIELVAADGLPATGNLLTATFVANTGGTVSPASVPLGANGRAQSSLTLGAGAGGIYLYTVSVGSFSTIIPEIAAVGPPTQLIANGPTTITMTAGAPPTSIPSFRVADAAGNSVPGVPLVATIKQGTSQDSIVFLADTIGLGDVSKIAAKLTVAGTTTVTITSGNTATPFPALTYTIIVAPASATKLAFGQQPTSAVATAVISPAVTVLIQDQFGTTVTSAPPVVTIALDPLTTAGMTLNGTKSVSAVNGVATFSTLSMAPAKTAVKLQATAAAGALAATTSAAFNITP